MKSKTIIGVLLAVGALGFLAGCGNDDGSDSTSSASPSEELTITDAWARKTPSGAMVGAAYATITGGKTDDTLTGVSVPSDVAATAEIHQMTGAGADMTVPDDMSGMGEGDPSSTTASSGAMTMEPVESIEIPAGESVEFAPGGYHVMLMDLTKPLAIGDVVPLTFEFERAGDVVVNAEVTE